MPRRILEGKVVSDKQDKTVTVLVERRVMHPIYKKYVKKSNKFAAHDEANKVKEGDVIQIIECKPISKNKRFTVYTGQSSQTKPQKTEEKPAETVKKETTTAKSDKPKAEKKEAAKKTTTKKAAPKKTTAKKEEK